MATPSITQQRKSDDLFGYAEGESHILGEKEGRESDGTSAKGR